MCRFQEEEFTKYIYVASPCFSPSFSVPPFSVLPLVPILAY